MLKKKVDALVTRSVSMYSGRPERQPASWATTQIWGEGSWRACAAGLGNDGDGTRAKLAAVDGTNYFA